MNSFGSFELLSSTKTRRFEFPSGASFNYAQHARKYGEAGWCTFNSRCTKHGYQRLSSVRFGGFWVSPERSWLTHGCCLETKDWHRLLPTASQSLKLVKSIKNHNPLDDEEDKENSPYTTPITEKPNWPPVLIRSQAIGTQIEKISDLIHKSFYLIHIYNVLILIKFLIKLFVFIQNLSKNHSNLCETRTDLALLSIMFLLGAGFSVYRSHIEKNLEHHSEAKSQSPCEKKFKYYCLKGGCYYLVDEIILYFDFTYGMENEVVNSTCGET